MTNEIIRGFNLEDLLNVMDAKANISFFTSETAAPVKDNVRVFRLLADEEFIATYGKYKVTGLVNFVHVINILAKEI